ncbi:unnamed protein product [Trifolium pratense]|uniref:Uncharacterized protein n=1 Tax=Trifolium pratense TaxID=57577 RepID=A0ACB0IWY5_TRIPR|nr:unnamed protein product [Trifolium pratense]
MHKNAGGLGFKSIEAFNYAMLGKQAWKLLSDPSNLITKFFKAKYFPKSDFLDSSIGHNPSYVWRSIWSAKFIVRGGYKWSIGTGNHIPVWNHKWSLDGDIFTRPVHMNHVMDTMRVSDLLMSDSKMWNLPLICSLFDDSSARKILKTPLLDSVPVDKVIWRLEKDGHYSVKSAYRYCIDEAIDTTHLKVPGQWHYIWKATTPPKIKNFIWRLCRNCIPTRFRLNQKGVNCPGNCVHCDDELEDNIHLFFLCNNAKNIWQKLGWRDVIQQHLQANNHIAEIIFSLLQVFNSEHSTLFMVTLWSIWQQRNNRVWRNKIEPTHVVCDRTTNLLLDWRNAQQYKQRNCMQQQQVTETRWQKPHTGRYKCNIDASFSVRQNKVEIGMCIRDDQGQFVLAKTEWMSPITDTDIGEALGLLSALKLVHDLQLENVDFELYSKNVVTSFHSKHNNVTELGDVIRDCVRLHKTYFRNSSVEFIRRQANEVAHALARVATSIASFHLFIDILTCIVNILNNEML